MARATADGATARAVRDVKAADNISLAELAQLSQLFNETTKTQNTLIQGMTDNIKETLEALTEVQQALSDILQIMTSQSEKVESQMEQLVTVTVALTKATTALRALPVGSAVQRPEK